jgi:hypothetical protein
VRLLLLSVATICHAVSPAQHGRSAPSMNPSCRVGHGPPRTEARCIGCGSPRLILNSPDTWSTQWRGAHSLSPSTGSRGGAWASWRAD